MRSKFKYIPAVYITLLAIFSIVAHDEDYFDAALAGAMWGGFDVLLLYAYFARVDIQTRTRLIKAGSRDWKIVLSVAWMFPLTLASATIGTRVSVQWGWWFFYFVALAPVILMLLAESLWKKPILASNPADVLLNVDTLMAYGRSAQAIRALEDALAVSPGDPVLLGRLAEIRNQQS